jgi:hypothetical protein
MFWWHRKGRLGLGNGEEWRRDRTVSGLTGSCRAVPAPTDQTTGLIGCRFWLGLCPARQAWGGARAWPNTGFVQARPTNFCVGSCSCRIKNVMLQVDPLNTVWMVRYIYTYIPMTHLSSFSWYVRCSYHPLIINCHIINQLINITTSCHIILYSKKLKNN